MADMDFLSALGGTAQEDPTSGFSAEVPKTPEEMETRKSEWRDVLAKINSDPNILRAMAVTGLSLMQPGANIGNAGLQGLAAYEAGRQADLNLQGKKAEQARLLRAEERQGKLSESQLATAELQRQRTSQEMQFAEADRPMQLQEKQMRIEQIKSQMRNLDADNRRGDVGLSLQRERLQLEREMKAEDRKLRERELTIKEIDMHARRDAVSGTGGGKATDAERAIQGYMQTPEIAALPETERRAAATDLWLRQSKGMAGTVRQEGMSAKADQDAKDFYALMQQQTPEQMEMWWLLAKPEERLMYSKGQRLSQAAPQAAGQPQMQAAPAQPQRKVYKAEDIRSGLGGN